MLSLYEQRELRAALDLVYRRDLELATLLQSGMWRKEADRESEGVFIDNEVWLTMYRRTSSYDWNMWSNKIIDFVRGIQDFSTDGRWH